MSTDGVHHSEMPDELDTFLHDLRAAADAVSAPAPDPALATLFRDGAAPVAAPTPTRRWALRVAAAGVAAGVGFGGLGVAGALPSPVQDRVAELADEVGIDLPHSDDDLPATPTPVPDVRTTTVSPSAEAPGRTDSTPGQGGTAPVGRPEVPGRSEEAPGRSVQPPAEGAPGVDAHGRPSEVPARTRARGERRTPDEGRSRLPKFADHRNQTATEDVHLLDRRGPRPADDGGTNR